MCEPGLHIIHGGPDGEAQEPEVDVIAVHGLNFKNNPNHARATWTWSSTGTIWIRDFLPSSLQRPCRVLLFAYNSSPAMRAADMTLDGHAKELLRCLSEKREGATQRPIVFLCHSLGGIVVKSALVEATLDPAYRPIVHSTRLLVFFATPHRGGNYSGIGDVVAKIVRTGTGTPGNDLLDGLKAGSRDVIRRFDQARHLPEACLVISYFETKDYGKLGLIVEKASAVLDLPADQEQQVALPADHSKVCKFPTMADAMPVMKCISTQLERALELQEALQHKRENVHWLVPRSVTPLFTGRDETVKNVIKAISPKSKPSSSCQNVFVLTGIGGQGKSEVCIHVTNQLRPLFWGVFWVDVSSKATAMASFCKIAKLFGSETKDIDQILLLLANCSAKNNWLLVLDNADDENLDYSEFMPSGNRGTILMTSRLFECQLYGTLGHEELGSLSEEESVTLLLKAARAPELSWTGLLPTAQIIAKELGHHTLALIQAGAYVALGNCRMEDYVVQFQQEREKLLKFGLTQSKSRYRNVYATFEVSAQALEQANLDNARDALCLLDILSTFHYEGVPVHLLEDAWTGSKMAQNYHEDTDEIDRLSTWHASQLPDLMQVKGAVWNDQRLRSAISLLSSRALVKRDTAKGQESLSLHPLIHSWVATRQDQARRMSCIKSSRCIIALAQYGKVRWSPYLHQLQPHVLFLIDAAPLGLETVQNSQMFLQICETLNDMSCAEEVSHLLGQILHRFGADPKYPRKELLAVYVLLSLNQFSLGRVAACIDSIQKVLSIQESFLDEHHPGCLASQQVLARAYLVSGQWKQAISILENVRHVHENQLSLAKDDDTRLTLLHQLGSAYNANGQTKEAISLLKEVVAIQASTKQEADPRQIGSKFQLALAYISNCQTKEAIKLLWELDAIQREYLADNHPNRLELQKGLAKAYLEDGQSRKAVEIFESVAEMHKESPIRDDWQRGTVTHLLGSAYRMDGREQDAIAIFRRIDKMWSHDANDPRAFAAQYELGAAYLANGQTKDAIQVFERVDALENNVIDSTHPSRLLMQADLSQAYLRDGQISRAIGLLEKTINRSKTMLEEDSPNLLALQQRLGSAYLANGQSREAIKIFEGIVWREAKSQVRDSDTNDLACLHELGRAYLEHGEIQKATDVFEEVVKRKSLLLHASHPELLSSMHELARAYLKNGRTRQGIELCEEVVKVQSSSLQRSHPHQLKSMRLLVSGLLDDGQAAKALEMLAYIVKMERDRVDETHPDKLATKHLLGSAYVQIGQTESGIAVLKEVVKDHQSTLNERHPTLLAAQHQLASAFLANGQLQESISGFQLVIRSHDDSDLPRIHPSRLASMHQLGSAYLKNNQASDALDILKDAVQLQERLGEAHPHRLASQHELASCYLALDRVDDAIAILEEVCQIQASTSDKDDSLRLTAIESLSTAYLKKGNLDGAISGLEEVVSIRKETLPKGHPSRLTSEHMLGMAYLEGEQSSKGLTVLEELIREEEAELEVPHPLLLKTYYELGCAYLVMRETKRTVELLEELSRLKRLHRDENYPSWDELRDMLAMAHRANNRQWRDGTDFDPPRFQFLRDSMTGFARAEPS